MKVTIVSRPNPDEAIVQLQKNAIIRKINELEKSSDNSSKSKIRILKQRIQDIERKYEEQALQEKKELAEKYKQTEVNKTEKNAGLLESRISDEIGEVAFETTIGTQLDKRV
jgi:hypothetical protein